MMNISAILSPWTTPRNVFPVAPGSTYPTLAAALRAANSVSAALGDQAVIILPPGDYTDETLPTIDLSIARSIYIGGQGVLGSVVLPALVTTGTLGQLVLDQIVVSGTVTTSATLQLRGASIFGNILGAGQIAITQASLLNGTVTCAAIEGIDAIFADLIVATGLVNLKGGALQAGAGALITSGGTLIRLTAVEITAGVVSIVFSGAAGSLEMDGISNFYWKAATETLTNGTIAIVDNITP